MAGKMTLLRKESQQNAHQSRELTAKLWINEALKIEIPEESNIMPFLNDGVILCQLINTIQSGIVPRINVKQGSDEMPAFRKMQNISFFLQACTTLQIPTSELFAVSDLLEGKEEVRVVKTISSLHEILIKKSSEKPRSKARVVNTRKDGTPESPGFRKQFSKTDFNSNIPRQFSNPSFAVPIQPESPIPKRVESPPPPKPNVIIEPPKPIKPVEPPPPKPVVIEPTRIPVPPKEVETPPEPKPVVTKEPESIQAPTPMVPEISKLNITPTTPTTTPTPTTETTETDQNNLAKRESVVNTIINAEEAYISDLDVLDQIYYAKITKEVSDADKHLIFSNFSEILELHKQLRRDLTSLRLRSLSNPGDVLVAQTLLESIGSFFELYGHYFETFPEAYSVYMKCKESEDFDIFLEYTKNKPQCQNRNLDEFLTMPLDRVNDYPEHYKDLVDSTPENHPDYQYAKQLYVKAVELVKVLSEKKKIAENQHKILDIQRKLDTKDVTLVTPSRWFIREGWFKVSSKKGKAPEDRFVHLFNDMIVYSKLGGFMKKEDNFVVKEMIPLSVVTVEDDLTDSLSFDLLRNDKKKTYSMSLNTQDEKNKWLSDIQKAIQILHDSKLNPFAISAKNIFTQGFAIPRSPRTASTTPRSET